MENASPSFSFPAPLKRPAARRTAQENENRNTKSSLQDAAVIQTNDDAAASKLSAIRLGYWRDDFLHHFVRAPTRRPPLFNRGYYTRVAAIHNLLQQFLKAGGTQLPKQVVVLGAGFDTTYFQKKSEGLFQDSTTFFELDFAEVVKRKSAIIMSNRELLGLLGDESSISMTHDGLHAKNYHLVAADLRAIGDVNKALEAAGLDKGIPTLFLSECVLIYMNDEHSSAVIRWAATFQRAVFVTYEQILPDDAFGRMMLKNLEERNVHLHGLRSRPDIETQRRAYLGLDWEEVQVEDMNKISASLLGREELTRLNRIEMFDEIEEWRLTQAHYCIVLATKDTSKSSLWADLHLP
jgi:tRNA wybutosine-synthesizing protein 4